MFDYGVRGTGFDTHPEWHFFFISSTFFLTIDGKAYSCSIIVTCNIGCLLSQMNQFIYLFLFSSPCSCFLNEWFSFIPFLFVCLHVLGSLSAYFFILFFSFSSCLQPFLLFLSNAWFYILFFFVSPACSYKCMVFLFSFSFLMHGFLLFSFIFLSECMLFHSFLFLFHSNAWLSIFPFSFLFPFFAFTFLFPFFPFSFFFSFRMHVFPFFLFLFFFFPNARKEIG